MSASWKKIKVHCNNDHTWEWAKQAQRIGPKSGCRFSLLFLEMLSITSMWQCIRLAQKQQIWWPTGEVWRYKGMNEVECGLGKVIVYSASPDRENSQGFFMIFDTNYSGRKCRDSLKNVATLVKHPLYNKICCRPTIAQCLKPSRTFALWHFAFWIWPILKLDSTILTIGSWLDYTSSKTLIYLISTTIPPNRNLFSRNTKLNSVTRSSSALTAKIGL